MAVSKIRTNEELQNPDLNYFIAFNIDPSETNVKKIEDVLNDKRKMFVRSVTPISIHLMELKNDIDQVMLNDAFRSMNSDGNIIYIPGCCGRIQEATVAKKFNLERAIKIVRLLCLRGYIEDEKISEIAEHFFVTSKEILIGIADLLVQDVELIKLSGIKREVPISTMHVEQEQASGIKREVPFSTMKKLEPLLRYLHKEDLYEFSGLSDNSATIVLFEKQNTIYAEADKTIASSYSKATMDLSGIAKVVFHSEAARKEYDVFRKTKAKIWDVFEAFSSFGVKMINDRVRNQCIDALQTLAGLSKEDAEEELYAYMR